jgi:hypothetical protein
MGLFNIFKKKGTEPAEKKVATAPQTAPSVPDSEKKYYQPDEYYTTKAHEGTVFEKTVVTFEERKKTCIPSERGLYVAEILLLEYCSYGKYPGPANGYPGFWWFEYGIRDVAAALKSLEERGYIRLGSPKSALAGLKVEELKRLLKQFNAATTGKKAELVERLKETVTDEALLAAGLESKYELTELGQAELSDNAYVPYMHKHPHKTTEDERFGTMFNVWSINKRLGRGDKANWREVVDQIDAQIEKETADRNSESMERLRTLNPELYEELKTQNEQLATINEAEERYNADGDIERLLAFWEETWNSGGLSFEGSRWHFRLADLYIKQKRYDDAVAYCKMIRKKKPNYADKADGYIQRIEKMKAKTTTKRK